MPPTAPPTVFLNGEYLLRDEAALSIDDRGTLFGDGVYEVLSVYNGQPVAMGAHLERLRRSLGGIRLAEPAWVEGLPEVTGRLIEQTGYAHARVYWQVTRGPAVPRKHLPPAEPSPTVLAVIDPIAPFDIEAGPARWRAILRSDVRWHCCWIKSLMLLPNTLARREAEEAGCQEAILHRDGVVTEATASNAMIVRDGELWTHPDDGWILGGITRQTVLALAEREGVAVRQRRYRADELLGAEEVLLTGTTTHIAQVTHVDGQAVGSEKPGPVTTRLHRAYVRDLATRCGLGISPVQG